MGGHVVVQRGVDTVGDPQQGKLSQCTEVAGAEIVRQRGVDLLRGVDVAVRHPPPHRLGRHVDQLDLLGGTYHRVGDRLMLLNAGDPLDHVVQRLQVLDVQGRDHVDAGFEQLLDVLPAVGVARALDVAVGQLVDEGDLRGAGEDRGDVHLLEQRLVVRQPPAREDLEVAQLLGRQLAPVGLQEADHDVGTACVASPALVEHGVGLADARCGAQVDAQSATGHAPSVLLPRAHPPPWRSARR